MFERVRSILRDPCGLDPQKPVMVGVSGGPDSLCLLSLLRKAGYPLIVAHFNHRLRAEADDEAASVRALADSLGLRFVEASADVRAYAEKHRLSIETGARTLRYRFLFARAREADAQAVTVGHTADDQVETVLMHYLRGAGLNGLKGMPYRTLLPEFDDAIPLVRPLLDVWRRETVSYCEQNDLPVHYDATNESFDFLRNRIRHELIPTMEGYNPQFREAIWRSARALAADHALLLETIDTAWAGVLVHETEGYMALNLDALLAYSEPMRVHLLRKAAQRLLPDHELEYAHTERAAAFLGRSNQAQADLAGGLLLYREANRLYVTKGLDQLPSSAWPQMPPDMDLLPVSMDVSIPLSGSWAFSASAADSVEEARRSALNSDPYQAWLDAGRLPGSLELRARRPGDRFEPLGLEGHSQKLSDFFINAKLPERARERWPLLCAGDIILWVPGFRPAHAYRLTDESTGATWFRIERVGEQQARD